jgi:hypothetical protein
MRWGEKWGVGAELHIFLNLEKGRGAFGEKIPLYPLEM